MRVLKNAWPTRLMYGMPPARAHRVGNGARGAHVVQDRLAPARSGLVEQRLGEQRREEVPVDELAGVVDEEAAVGVPVPGDAQVRAGLAHPGR